MKDLLLKISRGNSLSEEEAFNLFELLVLPSSDEGAPTDGQIGAFLMGTAVRRPTADELVGAARALRKHMLAVQLPAQIKAIDTAGTGGSGRDSFNTSTAAAFVIAGAGQPVAKHGSIAFTSSSGSADVIRALGFEVGSPPEKSARLIAETGFGFLFAPFHHPATKRAGGIRREMGFRTIFNLLGPLVNPADVPFQIMGVSDASLLEIIAEALLRLGTEGALVMHGEDGIDELSISGPSRVVEIRKGKVSRYSITPEDVGLKSAKEEEVSGALPARSAEIIKGVFNNDSSFEAYRRLIVLNAGAGLYISGRTAAIDQGVKLAEETILSLKALKCLEQSGKLSRSL